MDFKDVEGIDELIKLAAEIVQFPTVRERLWASIFQEFYKVINDFGIDELPIKIIDGKEVIDGFVVIPIPISYTEVTKEILNTLTS